jgi:hypothetical protein
LFEPELEDVEDGLAEDEWQPLVVGDVLIHCANNFATLLKKPKNNILGVNPIKFIGTYLGV